MGEKGMSSKVLNMKFMRQAEIRQEEQQHVEQERKLRDLSEWKTSAGEDIKAKLLQQKRQVRTVGYQTLNQIRTGGAAPVVGRRTFGETPKAEIPEIKKNVKEAEDDDSFELDKLWKKDQISGNKKRIPSGSKRPLMDDGGKDTKSKKRKSQS